MRLVHNTSTRLRVVRVLRAYRSLKYEYACRGGRLRFTVRVFRIIISSLTLAIRCRGSYEIYFIFHSRKKKKNGSYLVACYDSYTMGMTRIRVMKFRRICRVHTDFTRAHCYGLQRLSRNSAQMIWTIR